ncbi:MAG: zinc-dependent peptidase [Myxococcota bacterium]
MASWLPWVRRRHHRLLHTPLAPEQAAVVARNVPLAARLSPEHRATLDGLVQVFLDDKTFEGCGGLQMTDEIRLTVAALACLLLVGLEVDDPYPGLDVIRVYPAGYRVPTRASDGLVVLEQQDHRLGESSGRGYVVLSWRDVLRGARDPEDGQNVALHEFAHQLDAQSGAANGAPVLGEAGLYGPWAAALGAAYEQLIHDVDAHRPTALDPYGATNPAEFFAVAVEAFFERPAALQRALPDLYAVLARYFRQDPAAQGSIRRS